MRFRALQAAFAVACSMVSLGGMAHLSKVIPDVFVTRRCQCRADAYAHTLKVKPFSGRLCASYKEWVG